MISKILDNKMQGKVYEELQNSIRSGSKISIISDLCLRFTKKRI